MDIASIFPQFGPLEISRWRAECSPAESQALSFMFEIEDVRYPQSSDCVVSTSLYCKPHDPEKIPIPLTMEGLKTPHESVRRRNSWWQEYMVPLTQSFDMIPAPWAIRVHLAPDLLFLESFLRHPRVELRIMKHTSENTVPGMLWRYLPFDEGKTVMARGADSMWPRSNVYTHIETMLKGEAMLFRWFSYRGDKDPAGFLIYRTVPGPVVMRGARDLHYTEAAKAWIWHARKGLLATTATIDSQEVVKKFGMSHWARYGQDEQFLSHWLYYAAAPEGIYTLIDRHHQSLVWNADQAFVLGASKHARIANLG